MMTLEEARLLVDKKILIPRGPLVLIKGLSKNQLDEYMIADIVDSNDTHILFKMENVESFKQYNVPHKYITKISGMEPNEILKAYELSEEDKINVITIKTNIDKILKSKKPKTINNIELTDGLKIQLMNDQNPKHNEKIYTIKVTDNKVKLIGSRGRPKKER